MEAKELENMFAVTSEQLDEWERAATRGELPGEPVGEVSVGRPLKFGEPTKIIAFKEAESEVEAMDARAASLGLSRSDYLRGLVRKDLAYV